MVKGIRSSVPLEAPAVTVVDLSSQPHWITLLASWQHRQWREAQGVQELSQDVERRDIQSRQTSLQEHLLKQPVPKTLVAEAQGSPVGCISLIHYSIAGDSSSRQHWISNFYVHPDWRNKGIGSRLLDRIEAYSREMGLADIYLYTHDKQAFYRRRGWQLRGKATVEGQHVSILSKLVCQRA